MIFIQNRFKNQILRYNFVFNVKSCYGIRVLLNLEILTKNQKFDKLHFGDKVSVIFGVIIRV